MSRLPFLRNSGFWCRIATVSALPCLNAATHQNHLALKSLHIEAVIPGMVVQATTGIETLPLIYL